MNNFINTVLIIILLVVMFGCGGNNQSTNDIIIVDVIKKYSAKKELILQDFMDVEYIALETNDDFINQGFVQAIGREKILVTNLNNDGEIFIYDRRGKALRKINRKGQGGEEYTYITNLILDEDNCEIFVSDHHSRKIIVYNLYGKFKRSFKHNDGNGTQFYTDVFNYDTNHLICNNEYSEEIGFVLISKQDGSLTKKIEIPFEEKKFLHQILRDKANGSELMVSPGPYRSIILFKGNWLLLEPSSDAVYRFLPDYSLQPFIVRTPSIKSMDPEVILVLRMLSDRYYFMEAIKNIYDFNTRTGFPKTYFMYDRQEKTFFRYVIYNGDYLIPKEIYMSVLRPVNHEIESWQRLDAYQLVEAYKKDKLKGKLKEIAVTLNDESNPVIMLIKHKK